MTRDGDFKQLVRARMRETGERYTSARTAILREGSVAMVPVKVDVLFERLSEEEAARRFPQISLAWWSGSERQVPWLVLSERQGTRELRIICGPNEATAIVMAQQDVETPRPMTHDLLRDVVGAMGEATEVRITEMRDAVFFAELIVADNNGEPRTISCRPSDGIALAVRAAIPILVNESLFPAAS